MKMKKTIILLLAAVLLLTGCDLSASSGSELREPVSSGQWADHPLLSLLPQITGNLMLTENRSDKVTVYATKLDFADVESYVQALKNAGFNKNIISCRKGTPSWVERMMYYFRAQDGKGNYVALSFYGYFTIPGGMKPQIVCIVNVGNHTLVEGYQAPSTVLAKAEEAWDRSPTRALLPAPPTENWQKGAGLDILLDMSLEDMFSYREAIRQAGFNINIFQQDDYVCNNYDFFALNPDGYGVHLELMNTESGLSYCRLVIYTPEYLREKPVLPSHRFWNEILPEGAPLPQPEGFSWDIIRQPYDFFTIQLPEMGYEDAVAYMQAIDTYLKNNGHQESALLASRENDPQKQALSYRVRIFKGAEIQYTLTYDSSRTDCPCVIQLQRLDYVYE